MAEVVVDLGGSLGLGFFIQWKQLVLRGWQLVDADSALVKDILRNGDCGACSPQHSNHERRARFQHVAPRGIDRSLYIANRVHVADLSMPLFMVEGWP